MVIKRFLIFLAIVCLPLFLTGVAAQQNQDILTRLERPASTGGRVTIQEEEGIRELFNIHLQQQKALNGIKGYRIVISRGSGQQAREAANKTRAGFISKYEDTKCYIVFENPFYVVYVGDFRTKSDALRFSQMIDKDYPDAFITRDITIAFPDQ